jgi:hypothetical protein
MNVVIPFSNTAKRIEITIRNSLFLKSTTEDYADSRPFGEGELLEIETNNYTRSGNDIVYSTNIEKQNYDNFTNILLKKLITNIKILSIKIETESSDIAIDERIMKYIFSKFTSIYFNLQGLRTWVPLPEITAEIDYLCIDNAQLFITQTILTCKENFILKNTILRSHPSLSKRPSLLVTIEKKASITGIKIANKVFLNITGKESDGLVKWKDTLILASDILIGFEDKEKNEFKHNGFFDPLLMFSEVNEVRISNVSSLNDIPYYILIGIKQATSINITDITRSTQDIQAAAPALQLSEYYTASISGITYVGANKTFPTSAFIRFNKVRVDSSITVSNAHLSYLALFNLTGINCQKISIFDSQFINTEALYNSKASTVGKLLLSNISIKTDDSLHIKALSLIILSSTHIESADDVILETESHSNIVDSIIKSNKRLGIVVHNDTTVNIKDTTLTSVKEIAAYSEYDEDEEVASKLAFVDCYIETRSIAFDNIASLQFDNIELKTNNASITDIARCTLNINAHYQNAPMAVTLTNTYINPSVYSIFTPGSIQEFNCIKCNGGMSIHYVDKENLSSLFKLSLHHSILNIQFDSVSDRQVSVISEDSLGSKITSDDEGLVITPSIESIDRTYFERIKTKNSKNNDKILYGFTNE